MNTFIRPQIPTLLLRVLISFVVVMLVLTLNSCDPTQVGGPVIHHPTKEYKWLTPIYSQLSATMPGTEHSVTKPFLPGIEYQYGNIKLDTNNGKEMTLLVKLDSLPIGMYIGNSYGSGSNSSRDGVSYHLMSLSLSIDTLRFDRDGIANFNFGLTRHDSTKRCYITTVELDSTTNVLTPTHHYADGVETRVMGNAYIDANNPKKLIITIYYFLSGTAVPEEPQLIIKLESDF